MLFAAPTPDIPNTGWTAPKDFPRLEAADSIALDLETYDPHLTTHGPGWGRGDGHIVGIAVGVPTGERWYFPMRHEVGGGNLDPAMVLKWAARELGRTHQPKIGANLEYDTGWLAEEGVTVRGDLIDVQYAEPLLDEHRTNYSLDSLAETHLGEHKVDDALYEWLHRAYGGRKGRAQAAQGRLRAAAESYDRAVTLDPLSADAHYHLGLAAVRTGELGRSREAWATFLRLAHTGDRRTHVEQAVKAMDDLKRAVDAAPTE